MNSDWLPQGKSAAVCFSIDDVHPGKSDDPYEAGGDLEDGALGNVLWLLDRHPALKVTLFVTADWRAKRPYTRFPLLPRIPGVRNLGHAYRTHRTGTMALDRHPAFVEFLNSNRFEIALHGLTHVSSARWTPNEFHGESRERCREIIREAIAIFDSAGLKFAHGMTPPCWDASDALLEAMVDCGLEFVGSSRDLTSPVAPGTKANMSGLRGVELYAPQSILEGGLVHIPTNFQATSTLERAEQILKMGGLLSIKAHIVKEGPGFVSVDGMDLLYRNYLHLLFKRIEEQFGDRIWWTSMGEISAHMRNSEFRQVERPVYEAVR